MGQSLGARIDGPVDWAGKRIGCSAWCLLGAWVNPMVAAHGLRWRCFWGFTRTRRVPMDLAVYHPEGRCGTPSTVYMQTCKKQYVGENLDIPCKTYGLFIYLPI